MSKTRFEQARSKIVVAGQRLPELKGVVERIKATAIIPPALGSPKFNPPGGVFDIGMGCSEVKNQPEVFHVDQLFADLEETIEGREELPDAFSYDIIAWLVNLRGALDRCAKEIYVRYGSNKEHRVYFPIAGPESKITDFATWVLGFIPGLKEKKLVDLLESFQFFSSTDYSWLPPFATLTNENKHDSDNPKEVSVRRTIAVGNFASFDARSRNIAMFGNVTSEGHINEFVIDDSGFFKYSAHPNVSLRPSVNFSVRFDAIDREVFPFSDIVLAGVNRIVEAIISEVNSLS